MWNVIFFLVVVVNLVYNELRIRVLFISENQIASSRITLLRRSHPSVISGISFFPISFFS